MKNEKTYIETILGIPSEEKMKILKNLYASIFEDARLSDFENRIHEKENVFSLIAFKNNIPVGFKIGYQLNSTTFYSWVGGILTEHRKQGIATILAKTQEDFLKKKGYTRLQTKSMNCFKPMLILNLKNGFNIKDAYPNSKGKIKILFEKNI